MANASLREQRMSFQLPSIQKLCQDVCQSLMLHSYITASRTSSGLFSYVLSRMISVVSIQHAWISKWPFLYYNEAEDSAFCFPCRKMFKEKKNKTSTKADPAFVCSSFKAYFLFF